MIISGSGPAAVGTAVRARKDDQLDGSITSENNATITAAQAALIEKIKASIAAGDKAAQKAENHYIAAGQYLIELKAGHGGTWDEWEALIRSKIGIGKSRASELMQIADGRKTVEGVRANSAERKAKERKSLRDVTEKPEADAAPVKAKPLPAQARREIEAAQAHAAELEAAHEHDQNLAEKLRAAEIKIAGLESENAELKAERDQLRQSLAEAHAANLALVERLKVHVAVEPPAPKKRGRPPGSKNKLKPPAAVAADGSDPGPIPAFLDRTGGA